MFYREMLRIIGFYLLLYGALLLIPLCLAGYYQFIANPQSHPQPHSTAAFFYTIGICVGLSALCLIVSRQAKAVLYRREALATVVIIWFLTPAIGSLPFILSDTLKRFDQSYLEAASSFSTTGMSVMEAKHFDAKTGEEIPWVKTFCGTSPNTYEYYGTIQPVIDPYTGKKLEGLEAVSKAILFWRGLSQWLGGMGIIVLFVAFLPALGIGGKFLFQMESSSYVKEGLTPRIQETALHLWEIYLGLTLAQVLALMITNWQISFLDALTLSFATISTGGLSNHNENLAYYQNSWTEWITLLFMWLGSLNFAIYYSLLRGKISRLWNSDFLLYVGLIILISLFISWRLIGVPNIALSGENLGVYSLGGALKQGFFQAISAQTSTGFYLTNYDTWPAIVKLVLLISMFIGGMSGSTAGGVKVFRIQLLYQILRHKIESIFMPQTIKIVRVGNREIDQTMMVSTLGFLLIAIVACILATFFYMLDHLDAESALTLAITAVSDAGLGFRIHGPIGSLAFLSPFSAYMSSFLMILGRLEFYVVLAVLLPNFWRTRI